ncbi:MAG: FAD binding domain-containing protein [Sulfurifustaceae bacterium]
MFPSEFAYHAPASLAQALELLGRYREDAKLLAGGHSLLPMMKLRFAAPAHLIDLNGVTELKGVREKNGVLYIGAMTTESELIASALVRERCPLIIEAARQIADPQVRNRGTIGGDVAHGDPGNDHPAVMLALGASFLLRGPDNERVVAADGFYLGPLQTALAPDEILTEIRIPLPPAKSGHSYQKLKRKIGDFATAAAAVQLTLKSGACERIGIALTNLAPTPLKVATAEKLMTGKKIDDTLIAQASRLAMEACDPSADLRGPVEYKRHMAGEMTKRALREALARAQ